MASKVPKFGAWEGGENYTVYFENARKTKSNGQAINPNDPEDNPEMFTHNGTPSQTPPTQAQVPQFGAWDSGDNVGYTYYFENARKPKKSGPISKDENRVQAPAQAQAEASPARTKPESQAQSKVPQFGAWNEGESVAYTAYFDNARKSKNDGSGDLADRAGAPPKAKLEEHKDGKDGGPERETSLGSAGSLGGSETPHRHGRHTPGGHTPQHPKGGKSHLKPVSHGSQNSSERGATIPQFGVWHTDPSQADSFTGEFMRARQDRMTPSNRINPASGQHQQSQKSNETKKTCCFCWFWIRNLF